MKKKFKIYNTLDRKKIDFVPLNEEHIKIYACGPTVYNYAHIGNGRMAVVCDLLVKVLRTIYKKVTYVSNITDIDDKIILAAKESNKKITDITEKFLNIYNEDMSSLGVEKPSIQPKATDYINEMICLIETLLQNKNAYVMKEHVLFHVPTFKSYGVLSKRTLEEQIAGSRIEVAPFKKHPSDFVLWKPSKPDEPKWSSPWGEGRPGWHLECSAMSEKCLGLPFDIHAGGVDLTFPHHENEIAQSCSIKKSKNPKSFARNWFHNGFVMSNGEKMSKSLGNIRLIHDIKKEFSGEIIRFALLTTHYRQPLNWNNEVLNQSKRNLDKFYRLLNTLSDVEVEEISHKDIPTEFLDCLLDDLNTPKAFAYLYKLINAFSLKKNNEKIMFKRIILSTGKILGLFQSNPEKWLGYESKNEISKDINDLIELRNQAREKKDFLKADEYREKLKEMGIEIEDNQSGTKWRRK